ncbi:MAG: hypothetical protein COB79_03005 [Zetaproteobacteria bacterium]|nr:MAG: hypothetical protein COB79_03005 [Zetaproteobacteria bacterium]
MGSRIVSIVTLCSAVFYWSIIAIHEPTTIPKHKNLSEIVIAAPVQVFTYAGDRFLAANIEAIRASANLTTLDTQNFRLRAHKVASLLNPCHEDNYWFGNASLSWGGSVDQGLELLRNATHCRIWDEWPPFFYAFNQNFFRQDVEEAQRALEIAAQRSGANAAAFRTYATMVGLDRVKNTKKALKILQHERNQARDPDLKEMLNQRVVRLEGLLILMAAQKAYEDKLGHTLVDPYELLKQGFLEKIPEDPLKLGYEFRERSFHLKQLKVQE